MPARSAVSCVLSKSPILTFLAQRQSLAVIYKRGTKIQTSNLAVRLKRKDGATTDLDVLSASTTEKSSDMLSVTKVMGTLLGTAADDISLSPTGSSLHRLAVPSEARVSLHCPPVPNSRANSTSKKR